MRLGDYHESIRDSADIICIVCGAWHDSSIGRTGVWWEFEDGEWRHWCGGQWHPTKRRGSDERRTE